MTDIFTRELQERPTTGKIDVLIRTMLPEDRRDRRKEVVDRQKETGIRAQVLTGIVEYIANTYGIPRVDVEGSSKECVYATLSKEEALEVASQFPDNICYIGIDPRVRS